MIWFHTEDRKVHPQEGIRRLISKGTRLDSVVCYNDQIAMQVIPTLTARGIRVPEDISVTGYDNSYMAIGGGFQLTTIVHPQENWEKWRHSCYCHCFMGNLWDRKRERFSSSQSLS